MFNSFDSKLKNLSRKSLDQVNFDSSEIFLLTAFNASGIQCLNEERNLFRENHNRVKKRSGIKVRSFVGQTSRSKNGCQCCKKRKKKCDEKRPVCGSCKRLNLDCNFKTDNVKVLETNSKIKPPLLTEISTKSAEQDKQKGMSSKHDSNDNKCVVSTINVCNEDEYRLSTPSPNSSAVSESPCAVELWNSQESRQSVSRYSPYSMWNSTFESPELLNTMLNFNILYEPESFISQHLDEDGLLFFDYYRFNLSEIISVSSGQENFFKTYFIQLANQNISILYALAAWGGAFLLNRDEQKVTKYLVDAERAVDNLYLSDTKRPLDYMMMLSFCLIIKGLNVSTGDTSKWYKYMKRFKSVLNEYGGLQKFCSDHINQNEAKWLISNFFYHDVINSHSLQNETLIPLNDYIAVFRDQKLLEVGNFGIDPSSGCTTEAVVLIAEISSVRQSIKKMQIAIKNYNESLGETKSLVSMDVSGILISVTQLDIVKAKAIETFTNKINQLQPSVSRLVTVLSDYSLLELHLTYFELYQYVLRICLLIMIKGVKSDDADLICAFDELVLRFDIIIGSKLESSLCFPLLIIGMCCCPQQEREKFNSRYSKLCSSYVLKNVTRMRGLVLKCWDVFDQNSNITLDECLVISKDLLAENICFS